MISVCKVVPVPDAKTAIWNESIILMSTNKYAFGLIVNETAFVRMFFGECCLLFEYIFLVSH